MLISWRNGSSSALNLKSIAVAFPATPSPKTGRCRDAPWLIRFGLSNKEERMGVQKTRGAGTLVRIGMIAATLLCSRLAWGDAIDNARLLVTRQDAKNWLLPGHDYTNQRYVALEQINTQNVKSLAL